jgi:hypothetical protein
MPVLRFPGGVSKTVCKIVLVQYEHDWEGTQYPAHACVCVRKYLHTHIDLSCWHCSNLCLCIGSSNNRFPSNLSVDSIFCSIDFAM